MMPSAAARKPERLCHPTSAPKEAQATWCDITWLALFVAAVFTLKNSGTGNVWEIVLKEGIPPDKTRDSQA